MSRFEDLSNDVMEMIFEFFDTTKEILEITLVSPRINQLVSNSSVLMEKMKVTWSPARELVKIPKKTNVIRKYKKIKILGVEKVSPMLSEFVESHALTLISIEDSTLTMSELRNILTLSANSLKVLSITNTNIQEQHDLQSIKLTCLEELRTNNPPVNCDMKFLICIISTTSLRKFVFSSHKDNPIEFTAKDAEIFTKYLCAQKNLRELLLPAKMSRQFLDYVVELKDAKLKLTDLHLQSPVFDFGCRFYKHPSYWKFIEMQEHSLRRLSFTGINMTNESLRQVLDLNLVALKFYYCSFGWDRHEIYGVISTTIVEMDIVCGPELDSESLHAILKILLICSRLRRLNIQVGKAMPRTFSKDLAAKIQKLECLTLHDCNDLGSETVPCVKKLTLIDTDKLNIMKFLKANRQIKQINLRTSLEEDKEFLKEIHKELPSAVVLYNVPDNK